MYLFYGVLILSIVFLVFVFVLLGARNPEQPIYAREGMQAYVVAPGATGGLCVGTIFLLLSVPNFPPNLLETILTIMTVVATAVTYRMLNVRKKLAGFAEAGKSGQIVPLELEKNMASSSAGQTLTTPGNFSKAA